MNVDDILIIMVVSIVSAVFSELISWVLIYRTASYQKLKQSIDRSQRKLEKKKEMGADPLNAKKGVSKKLMRSEDQLKSDNQAMQMVKMKSNFSVMFIMIALFGVLNSIYDGRVIARLPFEPFSLVRGITHRTLAGEDWHDTGMTFIYALCSMSMRANVSKFFGFAPRNQPSMFQMAEDAQKTR